MPSAVDQLYKQALKLSEKARGELAARLLDSVKPDQADDLDQAWADGLERRFEDLRTGRVKGHSLRDAMRLMMDDSDEPSRSGHPPARNKRPKARSPLAQSVAQRPRIVLRVSFSG